VVRGYNTHWVVVFGGGGGGGWGPNSDAGTYKRGTLVLVYMYFALPIH
jgi:hypothetical protein